MGENDPRLVLFSDDHVILCWDQSHWKLYKMVVVNGVYKEGLYERIMFKLVCNVLW